MTGLADPDVRRSWQQAVSGPEAYERYLVRRLFGPWAQRLVELAEPQPGERLLDVGCGTGAVARVAAARMGPGRVTGLDISPAMLAVAREVSREATLGIEWREGDAEALPLPDATFDVVLCQQSLQFFADRKAALAEMHRVTKPDGRLGLSVWAPIDRNPGSKLLVEALARHLGVYISEMTRSPFSLSDGEELRDLITRAGFRDVHIRLALAELRFPSAADYLWQFTAAAPWLVGPVRALSHEARMALTDDFTAALRPHTDDEGVMIPVETHAAVARR